MNCQEFENSFEALARGALTDARRRAEALAHEKACAPCAARLADERALSTGLRALATGMKGAEAPARVEAALLAAFRARAASAPAVEPASMRDGVNVVPFAGRVESTRAESAHAETPRAGSRRWSWAKTAAVASLAAAASLALFVLVQTKTNAPGRSGASGTVAGRGSQSKMIEPPPVEPGAQGARDVASSSAAGNDSTSPLADNNTTSSAVDVHDRAYRVAPAPRVRAMNVSYGNGGGHGGRTGAGRAGQTAEEVATEFIPLMQGAQYASAEEGHLVRVELPRTALASFGLPVNAEASGGRVKADVLLGEDGVARAIRFVR